MRPPVVTLDIGGRRYEDWLGVEVTRSLESLADSFALQLVVVRERMALLRVPPQSACTVRADGEEVVTGYIDSVSVSVDAEDYAVAVSGRSRAADLIDSQFTTARRWSQQSAAAILADIAALQGLTVTVHPSALAAASVALPRIVVTAGQELAEAVEMVTRAARVVVSSAPDGSLRVYQAGGTRATVPLVVGRNVLRSNVTVDASEIASSYTVRGQTALTDAEDVEAWSGQVGTVADPLGVRQRTAVIRPPQALGRDDAQRYAEWVADTRAAQALTVECTVAGWRERGDAGALWEPGVLVRYTDEWAGIDTELVVRETSYSYDGDAGATTSLSLAPPTAYEPRTTRTARRTSPVRGVGLWTEVEAYAATIPPREVPSE